MDCARKRSASHQECAFSRSTEPVDSRAALRAVRVILSRIERIPAQPRLGEQLPRFGSREVRRVLAGKYEIRYELTDREVVVLPFFHTREDR
jgi:hypothetical protein